MLPENPVLERFQYMLPPDESWRFLGSFGGNKPLWSLSLEWWFYIFFGTVFYWKVSGRWKYAWLLLSLPFALGYAILPGRAGWGLSLIWMSGTAIHYLLSRGISIRMKGLAIWLLLLLTAVLISSYTLWAILAIIALVYVGIDELNRRPYPVLERFFKLFRWPANYSYSIYIIHYPLLLIAIALDSIHPILSCSIAVIFSNIIAALFYIYFESKHKKIALRLKSKWA
jgi:peptidoglycan/LPS O-acetylase OafA/YrhL